MQQNFSLNDLLVFDNGIPDSKGKELLNTYRSFVHKILKIRSYVYIISLKGTKQQKLVITQNQLIKCLCKFNLIAVIAYSPDCHYLHLFQLLTFQLSLFVSFLIVNFKNSTKK